MHRASRSQLRESVLLSQLERKKMQTLNWKQQPSRPSPFRAEDRLSRTYVKRCEKQGISPWNCILDAFQEHFQPGSTTVELVLCFQGLDDVHASLLFETILEHYEDFEAEDLPIVTVNLASNTLKLDTEFAQLLSRFLSSMRVAALNLSSQKISTQGVRYIARHGIKFSKFLRALSLEDNSLTNSVAKALCHAIRSSPLLQTVNLAHNKFNDTLLQELIPALEAKKKTLLVLNLKWNVISDNGGKLLLSYLRVSKAEMKHLDLSFNSLSDEFTLLLGEVLEENCLQLQSLDLSHNKIGQDGAIALAEALKTNKHLKVLKLGFNHFGPTATYNLVRSIWANKTLQHLGVENTSLKVKEASDAGDESMQRLFNLKEEINHLKVEQIGEGAKVEVEIEFPKRQRLWEQSTSELQLEEHEVKRKRVTSSLKTADSVFGGRAKECDSKWFYDTPRVYARALKREWDVVRSKIQQMKSVSAHDLSSIHEVVSRYYVQLCDIYSWYAGVSDTPLCAIGLNSFLDMVKDSKLEDCREAAEIAFISSNYESQDQGRKVNNMDNPDQGMLRFEMVQAFIRIAHYKFRSSNAELHALSIGHALELLLSEHVIPFADKSNSNEWRSKNLYTEGIHSVFEHYLPLIDIVWEEHSERIGSRDSMSYKTYVSILRESNLLSASFTTREATLAFFLSNMMSINEFKGGHGNLNASLTRTEFLEALVRVAQWHKKGEIGLYAGLDPKEVPSLPLKLCRVLFQLFEVFSNQEHPPQIYKRLVATCENTRNLRRVTIKDNISGECTNFWREVQRKREEYNQPLRFGKMVS